MMVKPADILIHANNGAPEDRPLSNLKKKEAKLRKAIRLKRRLLLTSPPGTPYLSSMTAGLYKIKNSNGK